MPDSTKPVAEKPPSPEVRGWLVAIVGPSGAGKDTLIAWLTENAPAEWALRFPRRVITRPDSSGGENHIGVDEPSFEAQRQQGGFSVTWQAHGLHYGLPVQAQHDVEAGATVIVNGSRHALENICATFGRVHVIMLDVRRDALRRRLLARGREDDADIERRLDRQDTPIPGGVAVTRVDNSGAIDNAGRTVLAIIDGLRR